MLFFPFQKDLFLTLLPKNLNTLFHWEFVRARSITFLTQYSPEQKLGTYYILLARTDLFSKDVRIDDFPCFFKYVCSFFIPY